MEWLNRLRMRNASALVWLLVLNVGIWLAVKIVGVGFSLFGINEFDWLKYLEMPAAWTVWLQQPWTVLTYMFLHSEFFHLFFNMLCLYWFGRLFLERFTQKQLVGLYILGGIAGAAAYMGAYNLFPIFSDKILGSYLLGASASIMAIILAITMTKPNYSIRLFLIGDIKLKYIGVITVVLILLSVNGTNAGGEWAHLGGVVMGILYALAWKKGVDLAEIINKPIDLVVTLFRKPKKKTKRANFRRQPKTDAEYNQSKANDEAEIDRILDKIKRSGYQSLTENERNFLFKQKN